MSKALDFAVGVLAADRITQLVVEDEITRPIREAVERRFPDSKLAYLVACKACVSVWAGLAVSSRKMPRPVVSALALSAATLLLAEQNERIGAVVATYRRANSGAVQGRV